jgi:hypothetical protein
MKVNAQTLRGHCEVFQNPMPSPELKQSRRYFQVLSYTVGYEILAEEGRSGFGGGHFPKRRNR